MIVRLAANAAAHTIGGVVLGATMVLATCTVAQLAAVGVRRAKARKTSSGHSVTSSQSQPETGLQQ